MFWIRPFLALILLTPATTVLASEAGDENFQPPETKVFPNLLIPVMIRHLNLSEPSATAIVRVGPEGEVLDHVFVHADHTALIAPARRGLALAEFQPAQSNGEAVVADLAIEIHFRNPGQELARAVQMSIADHIEENIYRLANPEPALVMSRPKELDQPLKVIEEGETMVPVDENDQPLQGSASLEFFVNSEGITALPKVNKSDHPAITKAALHRLKGLRFEAPTLNGKPTVVKARLSFDFK